MGEREGEGGGRRGGRRGERQRGRVVVVCLALLHTSVPWLWEWCEMSDNGFLKRMSGWVGAGVGVEIGLSSLGEFQQSNEDYSTIECTPEHIVCVQLAGFQQQIQQQQQKVPPQLPGYQRLFTRVLRLDRRPLCLSLMQNRPLIENLTC